jgi:heterodisulfide reductase subunit A
MSPNDKQKIGAALVVGGGIAGVQASLDLANSGIKVYLLERSPAIGGKMAQLDKTFPTNSCGVCFMSPTPPAFCPIYECHLHDNIELLPYSEVIKVEGKDGDFNVSVVRKPRFVDPKRCTLCDACIKVCPVEVEREFGGGLEKRKAIYLPYPQAIPHSLVIDPKTCTRCGECVKVCSPGAIDMSGVLITPVEKDFNRLDRASVESIYKEVSLEEKTVEKAINAMGIIQGFK